MIKLYFKGMNRLRGIILTCMALGLLWSCGSTKSAEAIALKNRRFEELKELVATKSFVITAETAYPMQTNAVMQVTSALLRNTGNTGSRISLTGNGDYIMVKGDSVQGELAYYGEVRMVSPLNPKDSGINFEGVPSRFDVTENEKKQLIKLEFDIKSSADQYSVIMELYPNKHVVVLINCMNRTSIRYDGKLSKPTEEETSTK